MSVYKTVVISQPMLFPWVGMFEQIRLADMFVYYDDVQFSKGSLGQLERCYAKADYYEEMMGVVETVHAMQSNSLSEITIASMNAICDYFDLSQTRAFCLSSEYGFEGKSSERVLEYVKYFHGSRYVSGLGALNYLNHELFDEHGVSVEYMEYEKKPYPQLFGAFTPYVTILDLIANCGKSGGKYLCSKSDDWHKLQQQN